MKIQLGIRGSSDSINHILIKIDDLILMNKDEGRDNTGKNLVQLLNTLSKDHEISVSENVAEQIESELDIKNNQIKKYIN
jgi:hypothetical protein